MSSFSAIFKNKNTGEETEVRCMDDYFGRHEYGYFFNKDGRILNVYEMEKEGWERC